MACCVLAIMVLRRSAHAIAHAFAPDRVALHPARTR
jgi:hypothetical protein